MFNFQTSTPGTNAQKSTGFSFQTPAQQPNPLSTPFQPSQFSTPSSFSFTDTSKLPTQLQKPIALSPQQEIHPLVQLKSILNSLDPSSPYYKFQHVFYNVTVDPNAARLLTKPPNVDDLLWQQALQDNPNPSCMVPVVAVGFADLEKRQNAQQSRIDLHSEKLQQIKSALAIFQRLHSVDFESQISEIQHKNAIIVERLVRILEKFQLCRQKGFAFSKEEEMLKYKLDSMLSSLVRELRLKDKSFDLAKRLDSHMGQSSVLEMGQRLEAESIKSIEVVLNQHNKAVECLIDGVKEQKEILVKMSTSFNEFSFVK